MILYRLFLLLFSRMETSPERHTCPGSTGRAQRALRLLGVGGASHLPAPSLWPVDWHDESQSTEGWFPHPEAPAYLLLLKKGKLSIINFSPACHTGHQPHGILSFFMATQEISISRAPSLKYIPVRGNF